MALTAEQQAQLDYDIAFETARAKIQTTMDNTRFENERLATEAAEKLRAANNIEAEKLQAANQAASDAKRTKLEMIRAAKEVLIENRRTKPASEAVDITVADITGLAEDLANFVNV